jgi:mono/diheme cytochrome c family protein
MGPPRGNTASSPFDLKDPEVVRQGGRLFQQSCTGYCHGKEGRLSRAPALRGRDFDPAYLFGRIANGGNAPMPAFQAVLAPEDIWRLVAYILSLSEAKD